MLRPLVLLIALFTTTATAADFEPAPAPAFDATTTDGATLEFPGSLEEPAILLFWATWCPYCKQFMPHLQSIVDELGGESVSVYAISVFEEDDGDPVGYVADNGYQFTVIEKGEAIASEYGVRGTPGVFLIDADGQLRWHLGLARQAEARVAGIERHGARAKRRAPFWAAELRRALDELR